MRRVWVTRDEPPVGALSTALQAAGLVPVLEPVIEKHLLTDAADEIAALGPDDWLVLTSMYAIEHLAPLPRLCGGGAGEGATEQNPAALTRQPRIAVVGDSSRRTAAGRGLRVDLVSETGDGAGLWRQLIPLAEGRTVLFPRSSLTEPPQLPETINVISPIMYETRPRRWRATILDEIDIITVASPSAVRAVGNLTRPFASIGPTTSAVLREIGIEPWVEAPTPSFDELARAIVQRLAL